jgi:predicted peroxiredoxin
MTKKILIMVTHADENPEKATLPFVMANTALASDVEVVVALQSMAVYLAMKNYAKHVKTEGFPPLQELMNSMLKLGGKLYICGPCIKARNISPKDLIEEATIINAPALVNEMIEADATLNY